MPDKFILHSEYKPTGDQPEAIDKLVQGLNDGLREQVLLGVTGSGKTFTMANVIARVNRPTLVIAHNKTLAAQLCNELREFFPENRVEYFVSYYDYYMPESYIPQKDLYIEKDLSINDEIDKLRLSATSSLVERRDTIVVASVSCIYGLGEPAEYLHQTISIRPNDNTSRDVLITKLVAIHYTRNEIDFNRSNFRVKGDTVDIFPANSSHNAIRVEFFGDTIERICEIEAITGHIISELMHVAIFPATHYIVSDSARNNYLEEIRSDLKKQVEYFNNHDKPIEAMRINQRVNYDLEMIREIGYCSGIENYSRYFDGREPGTPPFTLLDYFPKDFILFIDESHMTIPQIHAMQRGDLARKKNLVEYGFRLPAAYDNRPLSYEEFDSRIGQHICISATPAKYELENAGQVVHQLIRPTGLVDPLVEIRPIEGQIDDIISEINKVVEKDGRILITTLTKKNAESLTDYLKERGIKVKYMHSDIDTLERIDIIQGLRKKEFDVLVGINLLREGLDIPEVMLICILDADKEGFLRNGTSLIQTIGRAARNAEGRVILYADNMTDGMKIAVDETNRRREVQMEYNRKHGITPKTIIKPIKNTIEITKEVKEKLTNSEIYKEIGKLRDMMQLASKELDFEKAIYYRDLIASLQAQLHKGKN